MRLSAAAPGVMRPWDGSTVASLDRKQHRTFCAVLRIFGTGPDAVQRQDRLFYGVRRLCFQSAP